MSAVSIVLADDHTVLRNGLRVLLEREFGCRVVGEAPDGATAIEQVGQLLPHVLVLDIMMPGMSGLEVIRQVRQLSPQTHIVVLSMYGDAPFVREAMRAGAVGYVLKEAQASEFVQAVREAAEGRHYLSRALSSDVLNNYFQQVGTGVDDPYDLLTESERAVLKLAARGETSAAIARQLSLSTRTVETYRTNLLHKLDLRNQSELVRYAIRRGLIPLD